MFWQYTRLQHKHFNGSKDIWQMPLRFCEDDMLEATRSEKHSWMSSSLHRLFCLYWRNKLAVAGVGCLWRLFFSSAHFVVLCNYFFLNAIIMFFLRCDLISPCLSDWIFTNIRHVGFSSFPNPDLVPSVLLLLVPDSLVFVCVCVGGWASTHMCMCWYWLGDWIFVCEYLLMIPHSV